MSPPRLAALVRALLAATALALVLAASAQAAPFTAGNLAVYRVGATGTGLVNTGSPIFIDEYTPAGTLVQSIPVPATGSDSVIASGVASSEGLLTRSVDARFLTLTGYGRALGGTGSLSGTTSATVPRVVVRADAAGALDTSTRLTDFASGNNPRSAVSTDGSDIWATGGAGGVRYTTLGSTTSTQLTSSVTNLRQVNIFNGQLYVTSGVTTGSPPTRVATVGSGLPTTPGQAVTNLPGDPGNATILPSPYAFHFLDLSETEPGVDTLYVADDGAGALSKFTLAGGTWTRTGQVGTDADDYRGLTATVGAGGVVTLYATRRGGQGATGGGELVTLVDASGYNGTLAGVPLTIATAATQTAFRGVALTPAAPPAPDSCDDPGAITDGSAGDMDPGTNRIAGGSGDDFIKGDGDNDFIQGGDGDDLLCGQGGNDTILDGSGQDKVFGEDGNDVLGAGTDADTYSGGDGQDRVSYATRTNPVLADIGAANNGESGEGGSENDTIDADMEDLNGGSAGDQLLGDEGANILTGGPGADSIEGDNGADRIRGGEGDDPSLEGGEGNDTIEGNGGTDVLVDGTGADLLLGGDGDADSHQLSADGGRDYANCGPGANDRAQSFEPADRANRNCEIQGGVE